MFLIILLFRLRKDEIASLSGPNEFAEFYSRLREIREFYRKHPHEVCYISFLQSTVLVNVT